MSIFLECGDDNDLMLLANNLRKEYNKKRELWHNDADRYFNQSIASNYYSEEKLSEGILECARLKLQYKEVCDELKKRGYHPSIGNSWAKVDLFVSLIPRV